MASKQLIEDVWEKAKPIRGLNPDVWRWDGGGNRIRFASYRTEGDYGWKIDHKNPLAKGGTNNIRNLQALHWEEIREKGA